MTSKNLLKTHIAKALRNLSPYGLSLRRSITLKVSHKNLVYPIKRSSIYSYHNVQKRKKARSCMAIVMLFLNNNDTSFFQLLREASNQHSLYQRGVKLAWFVPQASWKRVRLNRDSSRLRLKLLLGVFHFPLFIFHYDFFNNRFRNDI